MCSFQEAYYKVKVYSAGFGNVVYDGEFPHVYGDKVVTTDITSELQTDAHYCAIVSFSTHDQLTSISANVSFSEYNSSILTTWFMTYIVQCTCT